MHESGGLAAGPLGKMGQEGDDVMPCLRLDLVDAVNVERALAGLPDSLGILAGDLADLGHGVAGMGLDLEPNAELGGGLPEPDHFLAGVSFDHFGLSRVCLGRGR